MYISFIIFSTTWLIYSHTLNFQAINHRQTRQKSRPSLTWSRKELKHKMALQHFLQRNNTENREYMDYECATNRKSRDQCRREEAIPKMITFVQPGDDTTEHGWDKSHSIPLSPHSRRINTPGVAQLQRPFESDLQVSARIVRPRAKITISLTPTTIHSSILGCHWKSWSDSVNI